MVLRWKRVRKTRHVVCVPQVSRATVVGPTRVVGYYRGCFSRDQVVRLSQISHGSIVGRSRARLPSPSRTTHNSHKTYNCRHLKNRRTKKVHVQDTQNVLGMSCDDPQWPTISPNLLSYRGIVVTRPLIRSAYTNLTVKNLLLNVRFHNNNKTQRQTRPN